MRTVWVGIRVEHVSHIEDDMLAYLEDRNVLTIGGTVIEAVTQEGATLGYGFVAHQSDFDVTPEDVEEVEGVIPTIHEYLTAHNMLGTLSVNLEEADPCHLEAWKSARETHH